MLKHRNDVITQHRRRNAEENEEEILLRVVKRSKLKRHLFGAMSVPEIAESFRLANKMTWILENNETGERNEVQVDEQQPTDLQF